jgi:hypothetical protein
MTRSVAWLLGVSITSSLHAQQPHVAGVAIPRATSSCEWTASLPATCTARPLPAQPSQRASAWAVAASAILPGSGQAILATNRALPYLAAEAFLWTSYVGHALQYRQRRDGYRDLAARVARAPYSTLRPNGDFEYYERMTHYPEAGRFDLVAGGGIDPETDTTTFNGAMWLLARRTYWADPALPPDTTSGEWKRAVAFYQARAYDQLYRWSWTQAPLEYSAFIALIDRSNDANRRAMMDLGVIIANHVLSTVDAYITVRLRRDADQQGFAMEGSIPFARLGLR